ncbi:MAG: DUF1311 domain-containing protein [Gemmatimonadota bacterium]|nr:DUF1311 domain-containing protein [Gemmatimonadota bacterium]
MKRSRRRFSTGLFISIALWGCDGGSPSTTADEIAADSALAADLAIANRDTLLVDSIGEYRPADAAERAAEAEAEVAPVPAPRAATRPAPAPVDPWAGVTSGQSSTGRTGIAPEGVARPNTATQSPDNVPEPSTGAGDAADVALPVPVATGPRKAGAAACNSPALDDQTECVRASLASADMRLNRIYRALITEMRRQERLRSGQRDPASVQRLRVAQRAWLVYRDTECRRRGRGREGRLWARPRVRCLGQFSVRRANELADNFSRLTAP